MKAVFLIVVLFGFSTPISAQTYNVETKERLPDPDAPYHSQDVFDARDAHKEGAGLSDLALRANGVTSRRSGLDTDPAYIAIRGGNPRQTAVTWNGLRLDPPFGPGFDFSPFSPFGFDSLRVIRGGSSSGKGNGALSGAIDIGVDRPKETQAEIGLGVASFGTWQTQGRVAGKIDDTWGVFSGSHLSTDGDFPFEDRQETLQNRIGSDANRSQLTTSVGTKLSDIWQLRADLLFAARKGGAGGPSEFQEQFVNATSDSEHIATKIALDGLGLAGGEADSGVEFGFTAYNQDYDNPDALIGTQGFTRRSRSRSFSGRTYHRHFLERHLITASLAASGKRFTTQSEDNDRESATVQLGEEWFASKRLTLSVFGSIDIFSDRDTQWSFTAASIARLFDGVEWSVRAGRSSRVPDLDELYLDGETVRGNATLSDEFAWDGETTIDAKMWIATASVSGFVRRVDSTVLFLPVTAFLYEAQNVDPLNVLGAEARLVFELDPLRLTGWYTYTRSTFEDGRRSPQQPEHQGGTRLVFSWQSWFAFAEVVGRTSTVLDTFGALESDGFVTTNAGVKVSPSDHVELSASVRNVLDDRSREDTLQRPLPGRSLHGMASFRF